MAIIQRGALEATIASYSGTGSNLVLDLGFIPSYAHALDVTSGMTQWWWNSGFSSVTSRASQTVWGIVASNNGIAGLNFATIGNGAGGLVALDGSAGTGIGLTVGTDTSINISGHAYVVTAWQLH